MRVAAAAYPLDRLETPEALRGKLAHWVSTARADVLIFPEYAAMELTAFGDASLQGAADTVTAGLPAYDAHLAALAAAHGALIVAGSGPVRLADGRVVNRARAVAPDGRVWVRDKHIPTPWERDWGLAPGPAPAPLDTALGPLGLLICYDAEFPTLARAQGPVPLLAVPAATDGARGAARVEIAARARALEGQCIAALAALVGTAPWCPVVDVNMGRAGLFAPPDRGFPPDGVLAVAESGWAVADIDLAALAAVRTGGEVRGLADWPKTG